jgi:hypothetical protein
MPRIEAPWHNWTEVSQYHEYSEDSNKRWAAAIYFEREPHGRTTYWDMIVNRMIHEAEIWMR